MSGVKFFQKMCILCAVCLLWACLLLRPGVSPARGGEALVGPPVPAGLADAAGWVEMPAGARPAYIGIHGGTVPVSLLTSRDGQSMITFVGSTGNDFLRTLHKTDIRRPAHAATPPGMPESNATAILVADTAIGNVPVFYCTGKGFSRMDMADGQWLPFGLSEKPLSLEGQAGKPLNLASGARAKKYRRVLWQQGLPRPTLSAR